MLIEAALIALALAVALWLRPWRMLGGRAATLTAPWLATLVLLPWLWALPSLHALPLQLQWSGAPLAVLVLGWPLAIPTLVLVGALAWAVSPSLSWAEALGAIAWLGVVPATLALGLGAALRRITGNRVFVYLLGRAFLGTVASVFASSVLAQWAGHALPSVGGDLSLVARWLMAWGDGITTGMLAAVFVAFRQQWLATWSDALYLQPPDV